MALGIGYRVSKDFFIDASFCTRRRAFQPSPRRGRIKGEIPISRDIDVSDDVIDSKHAYDLYVENKLAACFDFVVITASRSKNGYIYRKNLE